MNFKQRFLEHLLYSYLFYFLGIVQVQGNNSKHTPL